MLLSADDFDLCLLMREMGATSVRIRVNVGDEGVTDARCFECSKSAEGWHHIVPKSRGGTQTVPLCGDCHAKSHHSSANMAHRTLTREGLQRAKARGVKLGSKKAGRWLDQANGWAAAKAKAVETCQQKAHQAYENVLPTIKQMQDEGRTVGEITVWLNAQGFLTSAKGPFTVPTVWRILKRYFGAECARQQRRGVLT